MPFGNTVASIAPNSGTPFPGFGDVPPLDSGISIIDFHGLVDSVIPYDMDSPFVLGEGMDSRFTIFGFELQLLKADLNTKYRVALLVADLGWVGFWLFHCLHDFAWADERNAQWAERLGKMRGTSKSKSTQPRPENICVTLYFWPESGQTPA